MKRTSDKLVFVAIVIALAFVFVFAFWSDNQIAEMQATKVSSATVPVTTQDRILSDKDGNPMFVVLPNGAVMDVYLKNGKLFRQPADNKTAKQL